MTLSKITKKTLIIIFMSLLVVIISAYITIKYEYSTITKFINQKYYEADDHKIPFLIDLTYTKKELMSLANGIFYNCLLNKNEMQAYYCDDIRINKNFDKEIFYFSFDNNDNLKIFEYTINFNITNQKINSIADEFYNNLVNKFNKDYGLSKEIPYDINTSVIQWINNGINVSIFNSIFNKNNNKKISYSIFDIEYYLSNNN
jgi:hypothetical protein